MPESTISPMVAHPSRASSLLSQSHASAGEGTANGDTRGVGSVEGRPSIQHEQVLKAAKILLRQQHKRGLKLPKGTAKPLPLQVPMAMMSSHQVQQLLTPGHLQDLLQRQQQAILLQQQHLKDFYKMQQQQIHLQLFQQQQHPERNVKDLSVQQLVFQLLHLQQRQLLKLQRPVLASHTPSAAGLSTVGLQDIWKELTHSMTEGERMRTSLDRSTSDPSSTTSTLAKQQPATPRKSECSVNVDHTATHSLFSHGVCSWPGCECVCENIGQFMRHLSSEHTLDDRSTAQCRVQMQVVQQLDLQLSKEQGRLRAMMVHLHLPPPELQSPSTSTVRLHSASSVTMLKSRGPLSPPQPPPVSPPPTAPVSPLFPGSGGAYRRRHHADRGPSLGPLVSENGPNYELYKNADIRPPFTYATLIRQAIVEASGMQLTLNEIYSWFTRTFAYFRRNAATWKNAVRHNLSLHKCFVRVENVKGAVWTVDEVEYQSRRSQKITGNSTVSKHLASSLPYGIALSVRMQTGSAETAMPGLTDGGAGLMSGSSNSSSGCQEHRHRSDTPSTSDSPEQAQQSLLYHAQALNVEDQEFLMSLVTTTNQSPEPQQDMEQEEDMQ